MYVLFCVLDDHKLKILEIHYLPLITNITHPFLAIINFIKHFIKHFSPEFFGSLIFSSPISDALGVTN